MKQKVKKRQTNTATDFFSTVLKATEQLLQQEQSLSSQGLLLGWNRYTQSHTADVTFQMESNGNISLSLTVQRKD